MDTLKTLFGGVIPEDVHTPFVSQPTMQILADVLKQTNGDAAAAVNILLNVIQGVKARGGEEQEEEEPEEGVDLDTSSVRLYGLNKHTCGYCHSKESTNVSYGMAANSLLVEDYEELMSTGWRRSGSYCYKLSNKETCCPTYTIRLDVTRFHPTKAHNSLIKRVQHYFATGEILSKPEKVNASTAATPAASASSAPTPMQATALPSPARALVLSALETALKASGVLPADHHVQVEVFVNPEKARAQRGDASSSLPMKVAAALKDPKSASAIAQKLLTYLAERNKDAPPEAKFEKIVAAPNGFLNFYLPASSSPSVPPPMPAPAAAVKGEAKTVKREKAEPKPPKPKDQKTETPETKEKPVKKAKESKETMVVDVLPIALQVKHKLEVTTVRSQYATNTVLFYIFDRFTAEMYALYRKYQITVHKDAPDSITEDGYKRFLVETPLKYVSPTAEQSAKGFPGFGSFHQLYRLDGRLICVGVIDFTPHVFSSVYLYYDPDLKFLSLGKLSALMEIEWMRKLAMPAFKYYYMGFYIHHCQKMRYKSQFKPSELACPEEYTWHEYKTVKAKLETAKYNRLNPDPKPPALTGMRKERFLSSLPLLIRGDIHYLHELTEPGQRKLRPMLEEYVSFIGEKRAPRFTICL